MTITPQTLHIMTGNAIGQIRNAEAVRQRQLQEEVGRQVRLNREEADRIIGQIESRATTEANLGRSHAVLMNTTYDGAGQFHQNLGWRGNPNALTDASILVWDHCVQAGFQPTLERWDDGVGENGGYNIVIHW